MEQERDKPSYAIQKRTFGSEKFLKNNSGEKSKSLMRFPDEDLRTCSEGAGRSVFADMDKNIRWSIIFVSYGIFKFLMRMVENIPDFSGYFGPGSQWYSFPPSIVDVAGEHYWEWVVSQAFRSATSMGDGGAGLSVTAENSIFCWETEGFQRRRSI